MSMRFDYSNANEWMVLYCAVTRMVLYEDKLPVPMAPMSTFFRKPSMLYLPKEARFSMLYSNVVPGDYGSENEMLQFFRQE